MVQISICIRCGAVEEITGTGPVHFYTDKHYLWMPSQKGFIYISCLVAMIDEVPHLTYNSLFPGFVFTNTNAAIIQILSMGYQHQIRERERETFT